MIIIPTRCALEAREPMELEIPAGIVQDHAPARERGDGHMIDHIVPILRIVRIRDTVHCGDENVLIHAGFHADKPLVEVREQVVRTADDLISNQVADDERVVRCISTEIHKIDLIALLDTKIVLVRGKAQWNYDRNCHNDRDDAPNERCLALTRVDPGSVSRIV
jgi:hypothetical protein